MLPYAGLPREEVKRLYTLSRRAAAARDRGDEQECRRIASNAVAEMARLMVPDGRQEALAEIMAGE